MRASLLVSRLMLLAVVLTIPACVGSTGEQVVDFEAAASGPADALSGEPLSFDGAYGWQVTLNRAKLHIGALYLAEASPASPSQTSSCILPGDYTAQVVQGRDVDLLSSGAQVFPALGRGTTAEAHSGQLWLTGGDVNLVDDPTPPTVILQLSGSARRGDELRPFEAQLTIAENRLSPTGSTASHSTICQERIVSPIATSIAVHSGGTLWVRVDPRRLFTNVDFGALQAEGDLFVFKDDSSDSPSATLYDNLKHGDRLYDFSWLAEQP